MQSDCRLIKYKDTVRLYPPHLACKFQPLRFASRQARCFLSQGQISKSKIFQDGKPWFDIFHILAEPDRSIHIHCHQFRKRSFLSCFVFQAYLVGCLRIAVSPAFGTWDFHIRQKLHIKADRTCSITDGTPQGTGIIGKITGFIAPFLCAPACGIQFSQFIMDVCIGGNRRADIDPNR